VRPKLQRAERQPLPPQIFASGSDTLLPSGYRSNFSAKLADSFTNSSSLRSVYFLGYSRFKQGLREFHV
jgi:hypothetical protein